MTAPNVSRARETLRMPTSEPTPLPTFLSIYRVSRSLGVEERIVRELIVLGQLEPIDALAGTGTRQVRYVTSASVVAYVNRARVTGKQALKLCTRCKGKRYIRAGTTMCGPCADRLAQRAADRAFARQQRKNEWWRQNGREWRERRALHEQESTQQEGNT